MAKKPTKGAFKAEALLIDLEPTSYNTRFRPNALYDVMNKINDDGLPVLLLHNSAKLPVGAWYSARVEDSALYTKFYIPKEVSEYDDVKSRIETDILDSVSIGFNAGIHDCSVCGNDIQDYNNCSHIPGQTYDIKDPTNGTSLGDQVCYVMLDDVKASEASLVHSGAVPAAKIVETSDKAEFFTVNKLNFAKGNLEVVHGGKFLQDHNVNNNNPEGENDMDKEAFEALKAQHDTLTTEFSDKSTKLEEVQEKYNTAREANIDLKEKNLEFKEKVDGFDAAVAAQETSETKYSEAVAALQEKVEKLAVPFKEDYKAPSEMEALFADFDTYMEQTKALPSGRQSSEEADLTYAEPDSTFKV